jgi:GNAT superfamily N-acetyltransferase
MFHVSSTRVSAAELSDGSEVEIRPITPDDRAGLTAGFERLSELSRYRRFLSPTSHLSARQLAYLTDVDHHDHEALVAIDPSSRDGLAVARYVRSAQNPGEAEFAVAVADDWQRRGLGTALLRQLAARARAEGITRFTGFVLEDNQPMRGLLQSLGEVQQRDTQDGTLEVWLDIPQDPLREEHERRLASWMRAAAAGWLESRLHTSGSER